MSLLLCPNCQTSSWQTTMVFRITNVKTMHDRVFLLHRSDYWSDDADDVPESDEEYDSQLNNSIVHSERVGDSVISYDTDYVIEDYDDDREVLEVRSVSCRGCSFTINDKNILKRLDTNDIT